MLYIPEVPQSISNNLSAVFYCSFRKSVQYIVEVNFCKARKGDPAMQTVYKHAYNIKVLLFICPEY